MATYPSALPTTTELPDPGLTHAGPPSHTDLTTAARDEIIAIAGELGTNPAGSHATVKDRLDSLARGELVYAESEASQSGISAVTDLTDLTTGEFTPGADRVIEVRAHIVGVGSDVTSRIDVLLCEDDNTELHRVVGWSIAAGGGVPIVLSHRFVSSSGPYDLKLRMLRGTGSGSVGIAAPSPSVSSLMVLDHGKATS